MQPKSNSALQVFYRSARRFRSLALPITAAILAFVPVSAQETGGQTGTVEGRVFNAETGAYVTNARVTVEGTIIQAFSDDGGYYQLRNVPTGPVTVKVSYGSEDPITKTVTVGSGTVAYANFSFNADDSEASANLVMLDPYVIEQQRFKNAEELAANEEKISTNIKTVVAMDSLGYVSDGSVGEFVRFLPGLSITYGGTGSNPDNATTVGVRGFDDYETSVLIDGMPVASGSPSGLTRAVQLDALSINNASRLEVIKVATPDMSQDAAGGTINLVTRGAFELPKATYDLSVAFNGNTNWDLNPFKKSPGPDESSHKTRPNVRFSATIPLAQNFGLTFSGSHDSKYSNQRNSNMRDWIFVRKTVTIDGVTSPVANADGVQIGLNNPLIDRFELKENEWLQTTRAGNLRMDWRPLPGLEIRANVQYSTMNNTGVNRRTQWRFGKNGTAVEDWGATYVTGRQTTSTFDPGYSDGSMTVEAQDREGYTLQGNLTLKYRKGPLSFDAKASNSDSYTNLPDMENGHFTSVDLSLPVGRMDLSDIHDGIVGKVLVWDEDGNPVDYSRLSAWDPFTTTGSVVRSAQTESRDERDSYQANLSYDIDFLPFPLTVKAGWALDNQYQKREGLGATYRMAYTGPDVSNSKLESAYYSEPEFGYAGRQYWADPTKIYAMYEANPEYFDPNYIDPETNTNLVANNYLSRVGGTKGLKTTKEAQYVMATASLFNNRLTIITGLRQTTNKINGYNVFNDPNYNYVQNADGTRYRDDIYTKGVKFDGNTQSGVKTGGTTAANAVLVDEELRARMEAAGVRYLPTQLELAPDGVSKGTDSNNLFLAQHKRYTRRVHSHLRHPATPQLQLAYSITDNLKVRASWSRETRLTDTEGSSGVLVNGADFTIKEADDFTDPYSEPGAMGTIVIANSRNEPEINNSYNFNVAYYMNRGGRITFSYYYKTVNTTWETNTIYNTDAEYESLLESMGLSASEYENYAISTTTVSGAKKIRRGFEAEVNQDLGIFGRWAQGISVYLSYSPKPAATKSGSTARVGWVAQLPVRAQWTGGISYSAKRFSTSVRWTWLESKLSYSSNITASMADGTSKDVQMYSLNKNPPSVKIQANYMLTEKVRLFFSADRVLESKTYGRISDALSGIQPEWASWRTMAERGIRVSFGASTSF